MNKIKLLSILCTGLYMGFAWGENPYIINCTYLETENCEDCAAPHKISCGEDREGFIQNANRLYGIHFGVVSDTHSTQIKGRYRLENLGFRSFSDLIDKELLMRELNKRLKTKVPFDKVKLYSVDVDTRTPLHEDTSAVNEISTAGDVQYNCKYIDNTVFDFDEICRARVLCEANHQISGDVRTGNFYEQNIACAFQGNSCPEDVMDCISDDSIKMKRPSEELKDLSREFILQRRSGNSGGVQ